MMRILLTILITFITGISSFSVYSQVQSANNDVNGTVIIRGRIIDGDTLPHIDLREVLIMPQWKFVNQKQYIRYSKLVRNIKITLPYARLASAKLAEINKELEKIDGDRARKRYLKVAEKKLFDEFEAPLRKLSFSQGRLLIRLIDRETGETSFELIRQYKGKISAFFWQGVARIFGANLKDEYDPDTDDKMVEYIIMKIDNGQL